MRYNKLTSPEYTQTYLEAPLKKCPRCASA
jgi:phage FluMu protein Com